MIIQGQAYWAKVLGKPQPAYGNTHNEWSIDITVDEKSKTLLEDAGVGHKIKNKDDERGDFITLKRKEFKSNGDPSKPIKVVGPRKDENGRFEDWPETTLIGNGSTVNVKIVINEGEFSGKPWKRPDILSMQVVKLEEYGDGEDFPSYDEDTGESWDD